MGLIDLLARAASSRAHVLVAETPGAFGVRVALERAVLDAGWCLAETVADADVLAVVGDPGPELSAVFEHAWKQMSEPRARIEVREVTAIRSEIAAARTALSDRARQQVPRSDEDAAAQDDAGDMDHGDMDHGDMSPDGIPLAEGAEDRDGLEMDELHLPLGPVLAHWPAGVVLRLTLHGDVVADAEVDRLDAADGAPPAQDPDTRAGHLLDAVASVLTLAGMSGEAARARRLRDACLDGAPHLSADLAAFSARLGRARSLRWLLRGIVLSGADSHRDALHARVVQLVDRARDLVDDGADPAPHPGWSLEALPELVRGQELSGVRLWMAALSVDLTVPAAQEHAHG